MEKIRIDVVGLSHADVRDRWREYTAEALGKKLTLQPQPENVKDPYAVRVREGNLHIGYVAVPDLDVVYQALKGSGCKRLRGVVVESHEEPVLLTVECEVAAIDWNYELFDNKPYEGWHYEGISLMPQKLEKLQDLTDDLLEELEGDVSGSSKEKALSLTKQLVETNPFDLSREMTRTRYRIERLLRAKADPEFQDLTTQLRQQKGMVMTHDVRKEVAHYLFLDLPQKLRQKGFEQSHYTYDNRLDELETLLRAFPFHLFDKFLNDPVDFLREVYYNHVPRHYLFQLLSGIILMIMKGRTDIVKWGREGDTKPLEQIKSMTPPTCNHKKDEHKPAADKPMTEKPQAETFVERVKAIVRKAATKNGESMECNAKGHARTYLYYVDADTFCNAMDEMAATCGQKLRDFLGGPQTNVQVTKVCTFLGHVIRMHIINDEDLQMRDILFAFADYYPKTTTVRSKLSETSITDEQKVFLGIFKGLLKRKKA